MDKKKYSIAGINFEITLNSNKYKISDLFGEPQPYNLYINYYIKENQDENIDERIIVNNSKKTSYEIKQNTFIINTNLNNIILNDYNHQFSIFGNKGIIQKYILHILEKKYNRIVLHGCSLINDNNDVIIGLGGSGSGKSVLINIGLQRGWKLISTEQTIIDKKMNIYKGNVYDNVSPLSQELISSKLPKAKIFSNKRLIEPLGQKIFVDMNPYVISTDKIKIDLEKLNIIVVNFNGNDNIRDIEDTDYLLRVLQISSSEKISFPAIIANELVDFQYLGSSKLRESIIDKLIENKSKRIILSNGFNGFNEFFDKFGGNKNDKKNS